MARPSTSRLQQPHRSLSSAVGIAVARAMMEAKMIAVTFIVTSDGGIEFDWEFGMLVGRVRLIQETGKDVVEGCDGRTVDKSSTRKRWMSRIYSVGKVSVRIFGRPHLFSTSSASRMLQRGHGQREASPSRTPDQSGLAAASAE